MYDIETENGPECLVLIRNPWGSGIEWNGPWSDGSQEWETVSEATKNSIEYGKGEDGKFYMTFDDWANNYDDFTIGYIDKNARLSERYRRVL